MVRTEAENKRVRSLLLAAADEDNLLPHGTLSRIGRDTGYHRTAVGLIAKDLKLTALGRGTEVPDTEELLPVAPEDVREMAADFLAEHARIAPVPDQIKATRLEEMGFDTPQEGLALFSDFHYGSRIDRRASPSTPRGSRPSWGARPEVAVMRTCLPPQEDCMP